MGTSLRKQKNIGHDWNILLFYFIKAYTEFIEMFVKDLMLF